MMIDERDPSIILPICELSVLQSNGPFQLQRGYGGMRCFSI